MTACATATLFAFTALVATNPAKASPIESTTLSALGATDTVNWNQYLPAGVTGTALPNSQAFVSAGGVGGTARTTGSLFVGVEGQTIDGNLPNNTPVLYAFDANNLTLTFNTQMSGFGGQMMTDVAGPYAEQVNFYNANTLLTSLVINGISADGLDGSAATFAFLANGQNFTSVQFVGNAGIVLGPLDLVSAGTGVSATPLPGSVWMMGTVLGFAAAGYAFSQRKKLQSERQLSEPNLALSAA